MKHLKFILALKKSIFLLGIIFISFSSFAQINLDSGLVGYFKLDSNYADSSSLTLHGTAVSVTNTQGLHNLANTGVSFNGSSSYVNCGTSNRGVTDTITLSVWVKTNSNTSNSETLISKYDWHVDKGYIIRYKNGYPDIHGRNNSGSYTNTTNTSGFIADGNWHHVMGVIAGNKWEIWVDGILIDTELATAVNPLITNSYATHIGTYYDGGYNNPLAAELDEVRIYSRELLATEIVYLNNQQNNA